MFCPKCGSTVPSGAAFCPACGGKVSPAKATMAAKTAGPTPASKKKKIRTLLFISIPVVLAIIVAIIIINRTPTFRSPTGVIDCKFNPAYDGINETDFKGGRPGYMLQYTIEGDFDHAQHQFDKYIRAIRSDGFDVEPGYARLYTVTYKDTEIAYVFELDNYGSSASYFAVTYFTDNWE